MTRRQLAGFALALALAVTLEARPAPAQCAMCKATLTSSAEGRALQGPLNRAILLLLAAPYLVLGCFVLMAFRKRIVRRLRLALEPGLRPRRKRLSH